MWCIIWVLDHPDDGERAKMAMLVIKLKMTMMMTSKCKELMVFAAAVRDSQADKKELEGKGARLMSLMGCSRLVTSSWKGKARG